MRRVWISILLIGTLILTALPSASAAVTAGSKCSKVGVKQTQKGKVYTCIKLGKKLYWNNGVKVKTPTPTPTPNNITPTPGASSSLCKTTLSTPVINVAPVALGYLVSFTQSENQNFGYIQIFEAVSNAETAPKNGFQEIMVSSSNPVQVTIGLKIDKRWVIARLLDKNCGITGLSNVVSVKPFDPVSDAVDTIPPSEVTITSAGWVGNEIQIAYTIPTDGGKDFLIFLTNGTKTRFMSEFPVGTGTNQTAKISKETIESLFGSGYPTSFTGLIKSIDKAKNISAGTLFTISQKPNSLGGSKP